MASPKRAYAPFYQCLVRRLFGPTMHHTAALCSTERSFCVTTNQLLDLLSNNEVGLQWLKSLPPVVRAQAKETAVSTRYAESHFPCLYSNVGSGHKPTQHESRGVVTKLDAVSA